MDRATHWEEVHEESDADDVSWYQAQPRMSLDLLARAGVAPDASILDVGCGISGLAGPLLHRGYNHVTGLDLSAAALRKARARLGEQGDEVAWIHSDVLAFDPREPYDAWHDRALFHFLTDPADQARYADVVARSVRPGGIVIVATFAPDGPEKCSGLPVARHDAASIARVLGPRFRLMEATRVEHRTPWGTVQPFTWTLFRVTPQS